MTKEELFDRLREERLQWNGDIGSMVIDENGDYMKAESVINLVSDYFKIEDKNKLVSV